MTREEFYNLTDILNTEVLGNFMHGGEADELIAMFEEAVDHSNILEQEKTVSKDFEMALAEMIDNAQKNVIEPWVVAAQWKDALIELVKSEEPLSEGLEEAAEKYWYNERPTISDIGIELYNGDKLRDAFRAGAKWQKQKDALTWQDMKEVWSFGDDLPPMAEEDFFQAMLEHINKRRYGKEDS